MERVTFQHDPVEEASDHQGESSQSKGKGIDPQNWGGIPLDDAEVDPRVQRDMLAEYNARCCLNTQPSTHDPVLKT